MAEKSPAKNSGKTPAAKSLKEKRADKKNKAAGKNSTSLEKQTATAFNIWNCPT